MDQMLKIECFLTLIYLVFSVNFVTSISLNSYPNLPAGEYKAIFKAIAPCAPTLNSKIYPNWYLGNRSANSTEIKGNLTTLITIDDSLDLELYSATKNSNGGWNGYIQEMNVPKLCNALKFIGGKAFISILVSAGINYTDCPLPPDVYVAKNFQTSMLKDTNIPKIFFYGSYKFKIYITRKKQILSCLITVVDLKRPWEME